MGIDLTREEHKEKRKDQSRVERERIEKNRTQEESRRADWKGGELR